MTPHHNNMLQQCLNTLVVMFVCIVGGIVLGWLFCIWFHAPAPVPPSRAEATKAIGSPENIVCLVFDMGVQGWRPMPQQERGRISYRVAAGRAEFLEAESIECFDRDPDSRLLGRKVVSYRMEWWRPK